MAAALSLHPHLTTPSDAVSAIAVRVERLASGALHFVFTLAGDLVRLRIPAPRPPAAADELWRHTCFEAFVARDGEAAYRELNFSPSGEWADYAFRAYRDRVPDAGDGAAPRVRVQRLAGSLELEAAVGDREPDAALAIGLSAVVEAADGSLSYWALHHPAPAPDFHHAAARALRLEPLAGRC